MLPDDTELVMQAQHGDDSAFEKLIERYDRHVLSLAFSYTRNSDDTKDIYQETFIRAYSSIRKFQFRSEFSTWLYRIAVNVCLSFRMRRDKHSAAVEHIPSAAGEREYDGDFADQTSDYPAEADFMRTEMARSIEAALTTLSPMQRMIFTMKHYEGYKLKEIAKTVGCSEGTAKKHMFNAVRRLQIQLKDFYDQE
ncbi:MAG: RNA polymerase sigma factor [Bacteroidetes bacterium]|nr:RNA polymerase sigma factor [Bacteroidota bacterium]